MQSLNHPGLLMSRYDRSHVIERVGQSMDISPSFEHLVVDLDQEDISMLIGDLLHGDNYYIKRQGCMKMKRKKCLVKIIERNLRKGILTILEVKGGSSRFNNCVEPPNELRRLVFKLQNMSRSGRIKPIVHRIGPMFIHYNVFFKQVSHFRFVLGNKLNWLYISKNKN
jgi:hypothetical protein